MAGNLQVAFVCAFFLVYSRLSKLFFYLHSTANVHLLEALHLMVSAHGANHLDVAQALFRLGICFCEINRYSDSLEKFQECLEIRISLLGNLHVECANTFESIGIVQQKTGCHEDAIHSFERALAIKKTSLKEDDEDFCILLHFIGSSLFALKRYKDAVDRFRDSAERKKRHYGPADEEYVMSVIDLALACAKLGDEKQSMEVRHNLSPSHILSHSPLIFLSFNFSITLKLSIQADFPLIHGSLVLLINLLVATF